MQKGIRINESQLLYLASKGRAENTVSGYLHKKSNDTGKWQLRMVFTLPGIYCFIMKMIKRKDLQELRYSKDATARD